MPTKDERLFSQNVPIEPSPEPDYDEPQGALMEDGTEIQNGEDTFESTPEVSSENIPPISSRKIETFKAVVWACLLQGFLWVWCSYILAWFGREQIAESLSEVALKEIIAVAFVYAVKAIIENLSKHNSWPDKPYKERK